MTSHQPVLANDGTVCPKCGSKEIAVLVATPPRCFRCVTCRHTWDEVHVRPARDRRVARDPFRVTNE